jgi:sugar phosphate isomerase/epimerase
MNGIGLQLYTLRDALAKDLPGTLQRVATIGYKYVELPGFDAVKPAEWRTHLKASGLTATSLMFPLADWENQPAAIGEACALLNCQYAVLPWVAAEKLASAADFKRIGATLAKAAAQLKGIRVCYHNHAHEIKPFEGRMGIEWILEGSPAIYSELDVYWSHIGGVDPVITMKRLGKRIGLLHFKDSTAKGAFAPVGAGILDWPAIRDAVSATDAGWGFVEQDSCETDPFDCVAQSLKFLGR